MEKSKLPKLIIGDLAVDTPVIQGGMGVGISGANLASAVANEGGVGVIASVGLGLFDKNLKNNYAETNAKFLRKEIRKAKSKTKGVIGVNIMYALTDFESHVVAAVEEGTDIIFLSAGLPLKHPFAELFEKNSKIKTKFIPKISSARAMKLIFDYWKKNYNRFPDGVVVEGPMSGGHQGFREENLDDEEYILEKIMPPVIEQAKKYEKDCGVKIPVIAAGGVYYGSDIFKYMEMGANGVKMGTRFVATEECDAHENFKNEYVRCKKEDIVVIKSPVGLPARVVKNGFIEDILSGKKKPFKCPWKCLKTCDFRKVSFCIAIALKNAKLGNMKDGFAFAGKNAFRVTEIISVKKLFENIRIEYGQAATAALYV